MASSYAPPDARRGRGAISNEETRFSSLRREHDLERGGAEAAHEHVVHFHTQVTSERARRIISRNQSPDVAFDQSINPYRGCEHGCIYCFARPTHAYLGWSPGLDFETRIYAKDNAPEVLEAELRRPGYRVSLIALGANTDPYQPVERERGITRRVLEVLERFGHPVGITTKSALVVRDIDILERMATRGLARVYLSVGTLDAGIARQVEPRANTPARRVEAIRRLSAAGIPTGVIVAPVIPALTDFDIENVLAAAADAGAQFAGYVMLRLPLEVRDLFVEWLEERYPLRARHVMSLVEQMRDGRHNSAQFGERMRGTGKFAELTAQRFSLAVRKLSLNSERRPLRTDLFCVPEGLVGKAAAASNAADPQMSLF